MCWPQVGEAVGVEAQGEQYLQGGLVVCLVRTIVSA